MAGGKQSPRQKMINMMYLVLTALLALNISKEVLHAFVVVNKGLLQQKQTLEQKNKGTLFEFANQTEINPKDQKLKDYNNKATQIHNESEAINKYIEDMKIELIKIVDGVDDAKATERALNPELVEKKDDYDKPTHFFGTGNPPGTTGKANDLKKKLADYKAKLLSYVDAKNKKKIEGNLAILSLEDPKPGETKGAEPASTWEMQYFYHMPQSAALVELTKWQNIVRGAEAELLTYLWDDISAQAFKFDAVTAAIIPKSSFVTSGSNFEADVFLAAYSTTTKPTITFGATVDTIGLTVPGGTVLTEDKIVAGKGQIAIPASGAGERTVGGIIEIKKAGETFKYPFMTKYNVAPPSATVSPVKMNVMYRGLDNPIEVSVPGVAPNNIVVNCAGGSISGGNGKYIVKPGTGKELTISVSAKMTDGKTTSMGSYKFRVKSVPTPQITWANQTTGGRVGGNAGAGSPLIPRMEDFDFDVYSTINSFSIAFSMNGSYFSKTGITGNQIPGDVAGKIRALPKGTKVFLDDVKMTVPGGERRTGSATFIIQ